MKIQWDFKELIDFKNNLILGSQKAEMFSKIAKEISKELLKRMKSLTPVDEGTLINGWNGNKFVVTEQSGGYKVLIVNTDPKATWVNDGHTAHNQYGGSYPIRKRVKVTSPYKWQQGDATYYVFGHFFVERGILQLTNTNQIEQIIMQELQKWWDSI